MYHNYIALIFKWTPWHHYCHADWVRWQYTAAIHSWGHFQAGDGGKEFLHIKACKAFNSVTNNALFYPEWKVLLRLDLIINLCHFMWPHVIDCTLPWHLHHVLCKKNSNRFATGRKYISLLLLYKATSFFLIWIRKLVLHILWEYS